MLKVAYIEVFPLLHCPPRGDVENTYIFYFHYSLFLPLKMYTFFIKVAASLVTEIQRPYFSPGFGLVFGINVVCPSRLH